MVLSMPTAGAGGQGGGEGRGGGNQTEVLGRLAPIHVEVARVGRALRVRIAKSHCGPPRGHKLCGLNLDHHKGYSDEERHALAYHAKRVACCVSLQNWRDVIGLDKSQDNCFVLDSPSALKNHDKTKVP
jgi:hypothetical protein